MKITGGEHGFYDNEEGDDAVVYLEGSEPLSADFVVIPFRFLEPVDLSSLSVERFKREHPNLARQAGID